MPEVQESAAATVARDAEGRFVAAEKPEETFKEFCARREDEQSGRSADRDAQAKAIADKILPAMREERTPPQDAQPKQRETEQHSQSVPQPNGTDTTAADALLVDALVQLELHSRRVDEFKADHPDYEPLLERLAKDDVAIDPMLGHTITSLPNSVEIIYELAKDQELAKRIAKMQLPRAIAEIMQLDKRIGASESRVSTAPRPPVPVSMARGSSDTALDDSLPYKEWVKRREAQIRDRNR